MIGPTRGYESVIGKSLSYILENSSKMVVPVTSWVFSTRIGERTQAPTGWINIDEPAYSSEPIYCQSFANYQYRTNPFFAATPDLPASMYPLRAVDPRFGPRAIPVTTFNRVPIYTLPCTGVGTVQGTPRVPNVAGEWFSRDYRVILLFSVYDYKSSSPVRYGVFLTGQKETVWEPFRLPCASYGMLQRYIGPQRLRVITGNASGVTSETGNHHEGNVCHNGPALTIRSAPEYDPLGILPQQILNSYGGAPWLSEHEIVGPLQYIGTPVRAPAPDGTLNYPFDSTDDERWRSCFNNGVIGEMSPACRLISGVLALEPYVEVEDSSAVDTQDRIYWLSDINWLLDSLGDNRGRAWIRAWRRRYHRVRIFVTDQDPHTDWFDLKSELETLGKPDDNPTVIAVRGTNPHCNGDSPYDISQATIECLAEKYSATTPFEPEDYRAWARANPHESMPGMRTWGALKDYASEDIAYDGFPSNGSYTQTFRGRIPRLSVPEGITDPEAYHYSPASLVWSDSVYIREIYCPPTFIHETIIWIDPVNPGSRVLGSYLEGAIGYELLSQIKTLLSTWVCANGPHSIFSSEVTGGLPDTLTLIDTIAQRDSSAWCLPCGVHMIPKQSPDGLLPEPRAMRTAISFQDGSVPPWTGVSDAPLTEWESYPHRGLSEWAKVTEVSRVAPAEGRACAINIYARNDNAPTIDQAKAIWLDQSGSILMPNWPDELSRYDGTYSRPTTTAPVPLLTPDPKFAVRRGGPVARHYQSIMSRKTGRPANVIIRAYDKIWNYRIGRSDGVDEIVYYDGHGWALDWNYIRTVNRWDRFGVTRSINERGYPIPDSAVLEGKPVFGNLASWASRLGQGMEGPTVLEDIFIEQPNTPAYRGVEVIPDGGSWNY